MKFVVCLLRPYNQAEVQIHFVKDAPPSNLDILIGRSKILSQGISTASS